MSHPKRLEIINLLRDQKLSVGQIQAMLDLPQANLSQHLAVMRQAKIVETQKNGKEIFYSLTHPNLVKITDLTRDLLIDQYPNPELKGVLQLDSKELFPLVTDPVCHMRLSPKTAANYRSYRGKMYYFCASGCDKKFNEDPKKYQKKSTKHS
jgi:YHS domain-containing protein/DNA-binding transcriptional ArsR family regulator